MSLARNNGIPDSVVLKHCGMKSSGDTNASSYDNAVDFESDAQVGRLLAGYTEFRSGCGIAPIVGLVIPASERAQYSLYAAQLMCGPPIKEDVREMLVLVLLLRFEDVGKEFPRNVLSLRMEATAGQCCFGREVLVRWGLLAMVFFKKWNEESLTLQQVSR
jgi:hypothetical protein